MLDQKDCDNIGAIMFDVNPMDRAKEKVLEALRVLVPMMQQRPKLAKELGAYRRYVPALIEYIDYQNKINNGYTRTFDRYESASAERNYARWTEKEDELLIELVCSDSSLLSVSTTMGRSPSSIKTRVSKLVGLKRISQEIAGKFIGTIDGEYVEGIAEGTLYKNTEGQR